MRGMILAAGYGSRFQPATYEVPKPMVPVCNKPLISYACDSLIAAGVGEIVVNLHHLPEQIEQYLLREYANRCSFTFSREREILGTGGGVRKVREVLEQDEAFFLVNGDTIQHPPLRALLDALRDRGAVAALLLRHPPPDDRFTPVRFDGKVVTGFGKGRGEALMFAGAHAVSRRIFDYLPAREFSGLTEDVYIPLTDRGEEMIAGVVYDGPWFDIGTPRRYLSASRQVLELIVAGRLAAPGGSRIDNRLNSLLGTDTQPRGEVSRSVLGDGCVIVSGGVVRDSVLWTKVMVESGSRVESSVIAHEVRVPAGSRIENALVCRVRQGVDYDEKMTFSGNLVAAPVDAERPAVLEMGS